MTKMILVTAVFLLNLNLASAHGEDKAGPNGGFIRMPGGFHTEVVPEGKNKLKVYLLDIQWKNPSVLNSNLQIISKKNAVKADCKVKENYYICTFPNSVNLNKKGLLIVSASREGQKGMEVSYPLPLKLEETTSSHH